MAGIEEAVRLDSPPAPLPLPFVRLRLRFGSGSGSHDSSKSSKPIACFHPSTCLRRARRPRRPRRRASRSRRGSGASRDTTLREASRSTSPKSCLPRGSGPWTGRLSRPARSAALRTSLCSPPTPSAKPFPNSHITLARAVGIRVEGQHRAHRVSRARDPRATVRAPRTRPTDQRRGLRPSAGAETVRVTENGFRTVPYMSRTGFEQACSERGFYEGGFRTDVGCKFGEIGGAEYDEFTCKINLVSKCTKCTKMYKIYICLHFVHFFTFVAHLLYISYIFVYIFTFLFLKLN